VSTRRILALLLKGVSALVVGAAFVAAAIELQEVFAAAGKPGGVPHGGLFGVLVRWFITVMLGLALLWAARRVSDPGGSASFRELEAQLSEIYEREGLANTEAGHTGTPSSYAALSAAELLDCHAQIDRGAHPDRFAQLLAAIRAHVLATRVAAAKRAREPGGPR
jgi:hypothetical protein